MEDSKSKGKEEEKEFICSNCNFKMKYSYYGAKPPFLKSLILLEEAYVMKDPFSTEGSLITLGAHCSLCNKPVCIAADCSLFFTKRFCLGCVADHLDEFPKEIKLLHNRGFFLMQEHSMLDAVYGGEICRRDKEKKQP